MDKPKKVRKPKLGIIVATSAATSATASAAASATASVNEEPKAPTEEPKEVPVQNVVEAKEEHPLSALKIRRKLRMGEAFSTTSSETSVKRKPKPKMKTKPEERFHREVVLPTHQEQVREEVDVDGFDIEYVTVKVVEINGMEYFRDSRKNKLFRKLKEKSVGNYVGRYDPRTETILELPDSDCET